MPFYDLKDASSLYILVKADSALKWPRADIETGTGKDNGLDSSFPLAGVSVGITSCNPERSGVTATIPTSTAGQRFSGSPRTSPPAPSSASNLLFFRKDMSRGWRPNTDSLASRPQFPLASTAQSTARDARRVTPPRLHSNRQPSCQ